MCSFASIKDNITSAAFNAMLKSEKILAIINAQLERYGKVNDISINTVEKRLLLRLMPHGGREVEISAQFRITPDGSHVYFSNMIASELWITHIMEDFIAGKEIQVPEKVRIALSPWVRHLS